MSVKYFYGSMDGNYRFERCSLAFANPSCFSKLSSFLNNQQNFQVQSITFGLEHCSQILHTASGSSNKEIHFLGVKVFAYLDDWFVWTNTKRKSVKYLIEIQIVLKRKGFIINHQKSNLVPSQSIKGLVHLWNSKQESLGLKEDFHWSILSKFLKFLN